MPSFCVEMKAIVESGRWGSSESMQGRDGIIRAAKLRAGKSFLERPVQYLYPLDADFFAGLRIQYAA